MAKASDTITRAEGFGDFGSHCFYYASIITSHECPIISDRIEGCPVSWVESYRHGLDEDVVVLQFWHRDGL